MPSDSDARELVLRLLGEPARSVERFSTGMCHYVYDIVTASGAHVVARIANPDRQEAFAGAVYWSERLRAIGVPLAKILAEDVEGRTCGFAAMILERLPGPDLGHVYGELTFQQKSALATDMVRIRHTMDAMPLGGGFGFAATYDGPWQHSSWADVVAASIDRSRERIVRTGMVSLQYVDLVADAFVRIEPELRKVAARPFLDDATTKNVIVHEGRLSGIVDVDELCFGDPLANVALTHTALLDLGGDTHYTHAWLSGLGIQDQSRERQRFDFYVAMYLLDFLSEIGMQFNKHAPQYVDAMRQARLEKLLREQVDL